MNIPPAKSPPRYLPTLTEVVQAPLNLPLAIDKQSVTQREASDQDRKALVAQIMREIMPVLESELRSAVSSALELQFQELALKLQERTHAVVDAAVARAFD